MVAKIAAGGKLLIVKGDLDDPLTTPRGNSEYAAVAAPFVLRAHRTLSRLVRVGLFLPLLRKILEWPV